MLSRSPKIPCLIVLAAACLAVPPAAAQSLVLVGQWGTPGSGPGQLSTPFGVATDAAGNVYVADLGNARIQSFTAAGAWIAAWPTGSTGFSQPAGVTVHGGFVYVTDAFAHVVLRYTTAGAFLGQWGSHGTGNGQFSSPKGLATDAAGNVYVADDANSRIQKFTANGGYLGQWGTFGSGDGQLFGPQDVAFDSNDDVFVADGLNRRIQKFTSAGAYLTQWGGAGTGDGQFQVPQAVATDADGLVYVTDSYNNRIQVFTGSGAYLSQTAINGGEYAHLGGIAVDAAGNVYVAVAGDQHILKFAQATTPVQHASWGRLKALYRGATH